MNIPQNSLVLYKNGPARVAALGDKLDIELEDGRSLRVRPKDVLLLHPGPLKGLRELDAPAGEAEAACELLDGGQTTLPELADLVYGAYTPATAWAAWRLVNEGLYFQGTPEAISARPLAEVERERTIREAKAAERDAWNSFLQRARVGRCAPEDTPWLGEIEEVALGQREQSRVLQALDCDQNPQSAHALLLRLRHWDGTVNPWPRRIGALLTPPAVGLPALSDESRLDLTGLPAYAIDDEGNLDPDDALSLDGNRLWVHIADAAALASPDSPVDLEARARGATLYLPEVKMRVSDGRVDIKPLPRLRSRMLVTEAMVMAGEAAARFALGRGLPFPFTTQDPVDAADRQPAGLAAMHALRRSLRPRQYSSLPGPHGGLGLDVYAQVTSPLRRYLDLVAHQQLRVCLRGGDPLEAQAIIERVGAAEAAAQGIRRAERLSREHWTMVYLQQHSGWRGEGVLVEKRLPRGTVLIAELALETRVKVADSVVPDSVVPLRLTGVELPAREAYFRVG